MVFRCLLIAYMALTALIGPSACCCTWQRLAQQAWSLVASKQAQVEQSVCCCVRPQSVAKKRTPHPCQTTAAGDAQSVHQCQCHVTPAVSREPPASATLVATFAVDPPAGLSWTGSVDVPDAALVVLSGDYRHDRAVPPDIITLCHSLRC